jgi:ABC-type nitrate/sulfonate/bicarbonate transport system substrate-binding protein
MLIGRTGGGSPRLKLEKTDIVVNAFPAIDSAGLYIAQDQGLFAAQGLHVTIVPVSKNGPPPSTQDLVNGQEKGQFDITAGDYAPTSRTSSASARQRPICVSSPNLPSCSQTS